MMGRPAGALSVADKKKVLDELKAGKPAVDVAAEFEMSRRQVFNIPRKNSCHGLSRLTKSYQNFIRHNLPRLSKNQPSFSKSYQDLTRIWNRNFKT